MSGQMPKGKYVPHKVLKDGSVFFSVQDSGVVLELKIMIMKVMRVSNEQGQPAFAPDGMPLYFVQSNTSIGVLTQEEWAVRKQMLEREE